MTAIDDMVDVLTGFGFSIRDAEKRREWAAKLVAEGVAPEDAEAAFLAIERSDDEAAVPRIVAALVRDPARLKEAITATHQTNAAAAARKAAQAKPYPGEAQWQHPQHDPTERRPLPALPEWASPASQTARAAIDAGRRQLKEQQVDDHRDKVRRFQEAMRKRPSSPRAPRSSSPPTQGAP